MFSDTLVTGVRTLTLADSPYMVRDDVLVTKEGEHLLEILCPEAADTGRYTCKIVKFGKEGESETECLLNIIGTFLSLFKDLNDKLLI